MKRAIVRLVLLIGLVLGGTAIAGPLEDAQAADARGDYATALRLWRDLAEQGNAEAELRLGLMYLLGRGVAKNEAEAVQWFRKAAEQGNAAAQTILGRVYLDGQGVVAKDDAEAVKWSRKAAEQGNADAQVILGSMYEQGRGVAKDETEAVKWFRKAAEQGNANAQVNLGRTYLSGRGVPKDSAQAVAWYTKAANQGDANGQFALGVMYENGEGVPKDFGEAISWYRKAADQGLAKAQKFLGDMYFNGRGVPKNWAEANKWYLKSAQQGSIPGHLTVSHPPLASTPSEPRTSANSQSVETPSQLAAEWSAAARKSESEPSRPSAPQLELKEVERKKGVEMPGHPATTTVLIFDLVTRGMPRDQKYMLWGWTVGKTPKAEFVGLAVDESGKVICAASQATPSSEQQVQHCHPKESFQLALDAAKGEPKRFALISYDQTVRAFTEVIPFPIESKVGPCQLSLELMGPQMFKVKGVGFIPNEDVLATAKSEQEIATVTMKVRPDGGFESVVLPAVVGKDMGSASWTVHAKSCDVTLNYKWGQAALELQ